MRRLDQQRIVELAAAAVDAELSASRDALLGGLPRSFVDGLPILAIPKEQVLKDLEALNRAGALPDGTDPLGVWLMAAAHLAAPRAEAAVFEAALAEHRGAPAVPVDAAASGPDAASGADASPVSSGKLVRIAVGVAALSLAIGGWAWWRSGTTRIEPGATGGTTHVEPGATGATAGEPRATGAVTGEPDDMIVLAAATFPMGSDALEIEAAIASYCPERAKRLDAWAACREVFAREQPRRDVTVSGFRIDRTEVTYARLVRWLEQKTTRVTTDEGLVTIEGTPVVSLHRVGDPQFQRAGLERVEGRIRVRPGLAAHPAAYVTWHGADRFCRDHGGRLPTEAEWERAARGTQRRLFPWGEQEPRCGDVVFARAADLACAARAPRTGEAGTDEVGTATEDVTPEGVHDLGGGVAEWVADDFAKRYDTACLPGCVDPRLDRPGDEKVVRGGVWSQVAGWLRAAGRARGKPDDALADRGFRCAKPLP